MSKKQFEDRISAAFGRKVFAENGKAGGWEIRAGGYLFSCNGISITAHVNGRKLTTGGSLA